MGLSSKKIQYRQGEVIHKIKLYTSSLNIDNDGVAIFADGMPHYACCGAVDDPNASSFRVRKNGQTKAILNQAPARGGNFDLAGLTIVSNVTPTTLVTEMYMPGNGVGGINSPIEPCLDLSSLSAEDIIPPEVLPLPTRQFPIESVTYYKVFVKIDNLDAGHFMPDNATVDAQMVYFNTMGYFNSNVPLHQMRCDFQLVGYPGYICDSYTITDINGIHTYDTYTCNTSSISINGTMNFLGQNEWQTMINIDFTVPNVSDIYVTFHFRKYK